MTRARVIAKESCHYGDVGEVVGRDDPRPQAHPQPSHLEWEVFLFIPGYNDEVPAWGAGFMEDEIERLPDD